MVSVRGEKPLWEHRLRIVFSAVVLWPKIRRHVGVHVGDEHVEQTVAVPIEDLHTHRAPGRRGEHRAFGVLEATAAKIAIQLVVPLHRRDVEIRTSVAVEIERGHVARPGPVIQA